jgi:HEAT repeat protein
MARRTTAFSLLLILAGFQAAAHAAPPANAAELFDAAVALAKGSDADLRAVGLERLRYGLKGEQFTKRLVGEVLPAAAPELQVALLSALADRGDKSALPGVAALATGAADAGVRAAALRTLGVLGGPAEVSVLAKALGGADRAAARQGLGLLRGSDAAAAIVAAARSGDAAVRGQLLELAAERRLRAALPEMVAAASDADAGLRQVAVRGLERLGGAEQVPALVAAVVKAPEGVERGNAETALVAVCTKNPGSDKAAQAFLGRFREAGDNEREILLPAVGRVGGEGALKIVDELVASTDASRRQFGLKALTRWPDATVAGRIIDLRAKSPAGAERDMLLAALIRIAPLPDNKLDDRQKLELVQKTMGLCERPEDRARLLERANAIRTVETFRFVLPYLDDPALAESACLSVVELAHHQKLRDAHKPEFVKALDKVIATTKNAEIVERAERYKQGQTWERKKPAAKS